MNESVFSNNFLPCIDSITTRCQGFDESSFSFCICITLDSLLIISLDCFLSTTQLDALATSGVPNLSKIRPFLSCSFLAFFLCCSLLLPFSITPSFLSFSVAPSFLPFSAPPSSLLCFYVALSLLSFAPLLPHPFP